MTIRFAQITLEEIRTPPELVKTDAELIMEEAAEEEAEMVKKMEEKTK